MPQPTTKATTKLARAKRWLGGFSFVFGVIAFSLPLYPFVEHARGKFALRSIDKKHVSEGRAWSRPSAPSDPVAQKAFFLLSNSLVAMPSTIPGYSFRSVPVAPGQTLVLSEEDYFLERDWNTSNKRVRLRTNTWAVLETAVTTNRAALGNLHAALKAPRYEVPAHGPYHPAEIPAALLELKGRTAWWLEAESVVALHNRDEAAAVGAIQSLIDDSETLRHQRTAPVQGVRREILGRAIRRSWELLNGAVVSDSALLALQQAWTNVNCTEALVEECESEFYRMRESLKELRQPESETRRLITAYFRDPRREDWSERMLGEHVLPLIVSGWVYLYGEQTEAHFARHAAELMAVAEECVRKHHYEPWGEADRALDSKLSEGGFYTHLRIGGSFWFLRSVYTRRAMELQTEIAMTQTVIALQRFRNATGLYPTNLAELAPALLPREPWDWFSGQSLRYRCESGTNFILYSVGRDGRDDGGLLRGNLPSSAWGDRDEIWARPASAETIEKWRKKAAR